MDALIEVDQLADGVVDLIGARRAARPDERAERERRGEAPIKPER
ncbi:MAG TPA: hypothetical protein VN962_01005 [Polyangia bacterium]|nr:hypothetical protein [Polyangia bacterium]